MRSHSPLTGAGGFLPFPRPFLPAGVEATGKRHGTRGDVATLPCGFKTFSLHTYQTPSSFRAAKGVRPGTCVQAIGLLLLGSSVDRSERTV